MAQPEAAVKSDDGHGICELETGTLEAAGAEKSAGSVLKEDPEAASALAASEFAPFFVPVEKAVSPSAPEPPDPASFVSSEAEAGFKEPVYPVHGFVAEKKTAQTDVPAISVDMTALEGAAQPSVIVLLEKTAPAPAANEIRAIDVKSPEVFSKEHFEVEIPAEVVMRHSEAENSAISQEATAAPVYAGKAEAFKEALAAEVPMPVSKERETVENARQEDAVEGGEHAAKADPTRFGFMDDNEGHGRDGEEKRHESLSSSGGQSVAGTRSTGAEQTLSPAGFEKLMEAPSTEAATRPGRPAPITAEVHEKVQAGIKVSVESNGGEVRMKLNPESLGEVRIRLNVDSGTVKAEIIVENMEVKRIIESDSSFLRESLGTHGLTLDKCVVEVSRSFDARGREGDGNDQRAGAEQRQPREREQEKGGTPWQGRYRQEHGRRDDGRLDFFI